MADAPKKKMSTKDKAAERYKKIFEKDFMLRLDTQGNEDIRYVYYKGKKLHPENDEEFHKYISPYLLKFYRRLVKDETYLLKNTTDKQELEAIKKRIAGFQNYVTVMEIYNQKVCIIS